MTRRGVVLGLALLAAAIVGGVVGGIVVREWWKPATAGPQPRPDQHVRGLSGREGRGPGASVGGDRPSRRRPVGRHRVGRRHPLGRIRPHHDRVISPAGSNGKLSIVRADGDATDATVVGRDPLTDLAVINGGALVDCHAHLIGINTAGATVPNSGGGSIGLGFAIPIDFAGKIAEELMAGGAVGRPSFGMQLQTISPEIRGRPGDPPACSSRA